MVTLAPADLAVIAVFCAAVIAIGVAFVLTAVSTPNPRYLKTASTPSTAPCNRSPPR